MACIDLFKEGSPEVYEYLKNKAGEYTPETKDAWVKAAKELKENYLNEIHNVYNQAGVSGYEQPAKPIVSEKVKNKLSQLKSKQNASTQSQGQQQSGDQQSSLPEYARTEQARSEGTPTGTESSDSNKRGEGRQEEVTPLKERLAKVREQIAAKTTDEERTAKTAHDRAVELLNKRRQAEPEAKSEPETKSTIVSDKDAEIVKEDLGANQSFESRTKYSIEGGELEIGKVKNAKRFSVLSLVVDESKRRKGIATKLMKHAIRETEGRISGQASNDNAVDLNYKLGMRAYENGKELSLEETKKLRTKQTSVNMKFSNPEYEKQSYDLGERKNRELDKIRQENSSYNRAARRHRAEVNQLVDKLGALTPIEISDRLVKSDLPSEVKKALVQKDIKKALELTKSDEERVRELYDSEFDKLEKKYPNINVPKNILEPKSAAKPTIVSDNKAEDNKAEVVEPEPETINYAGVVGVIDQSQDIGGVRYELLKGEKQGVVKVSDIDTGNTVTIVKYPTYEAALAKYNETIAAATKSEQPAEVERIRKGAVLSDAQGNRILVIAKDGRKWKILYQNKVVSRTEQEIYDLGKPQAQEPIQEPTKPQEPVKAAVNLKQEFQDKHGVSYDKVNAEYEKINRPGGARNFVEDALANLNVETEGASDDFVKIKLSEDLPKKLPTKKERFDVYSGTFNGPINIQPVDQKVKPVEDSIKGKEESLKKIVSDDDLRPSMTGVYHDAENKALVATDAHKLVWIDEPSITVSEIINPKTGQVIDQPFPNYKPVIPTDNHIHVRGLSAQTLLNQTNGIDRANKFISGVKIHAVIKIGENNFHFDPQLFNEVIAAMMANGAKTINLELSAPNKAMIFHTPENSNVHALLMPLRDDNETGVGNAHKVLFDRQLTKKERIDGVQAEIRGLEKSLEERQIKLEKANKAFEDNGKKTIDLLSVKYEKEQIAELEQQIADKQANLASIENPLEEQADLQTVKENIEDGTITTEQAEGKLTQTNEQLTQLEPTIEDIESKAESEDETQLNEAIEQADELIANKPDKKIKRTIRDKKLRKDIDDALDDLMGDGSITLSSGGLDPEKIEKAVKVIGLYMKAAKYKFVDIIEDMYAKYGAKAERLFRAMKTAYTDYFNNEATDEEAGKMDLNIRHITFEGIVNNLQEDTKTLDGPREFIDAIKEKIRNREKLNIVSIRKLAAEANLVDLKDTHLQEMVELAVVEMAKEIAMSNKSAQERFNEIVDLYHAQPTITMRSSERIEKQQYSTPIPLAFLMGEFINAGKPRNVLEPNAGNGMLVIGVPSNKVTANEIDPVRLAMLAEQGFKMVTDNDALKPFPSKFDGIIGNPPFGSKPAVMFDGVPIQGLDEQMVANALNSMNANGRAAFVIGGHNEYDEKGRLVRDRNFMNYLYSRYNVSDVINVDGNLYSKQGTSFPVRIILINGKKAQKEGYAPLGQNNSVKTFDELFKRIYNENILNANQQASDIQSPLDANTNQGDVIHGGVSQTGGNIQQTPSTTIRTGQDQLLDSTQQANEGTPPRNVGGSSTTVSGGGSNTIRQPGGNNTGDRTLDESTEDISGEAGTGAGIDDGGSLGTVPGGNPLPIPDRVISILNDKGPYQPKSRGKGVESVIPSQMATETYHTLDAIEDLYGNIVDFVTKELGYRNTDQLFKAFSAEQIDGLAIAIHQLKNGQGMIIGDMTGVGKGRIAAGIVRYAVRNGFKPMFLTERANLFSDLWRDIVDINSGELRPFIVNDKTPDSNPNIVDAEGNIIHKTFGGQRKKNILRADKIPDNYDFTVATYSQFRTDMQKPSLKRDFFFRNGQENILIMDESHNASGESSTGEIFQALLPNTKGVVFLSATFAKRPNNMPVYAMKTAMQDANMSQEELVAAIERGGVALQEVVAANLVQSGQMIRRERSFEGVKIDYNVLEDHAEEHRKTADAFTSVVRDVIAFEKRFVLPILDGMDDEMAGQQGSVGQTHGVRQAGISNTPFASKTFQLIHQMLFAIKAKEIAKAAIRAHKAGEKPVIGFLSTMESFLNSLGIEVGEKLEKADFSMVLRRALDGTMRFTIHDGQGNDIPGHLSVTELSEEGQARYHEILKTIRAITSGVSISPIDVMTKELQDAGLNVGEITGRKIYLEIQPDGSSIVKERKEKDVNKISRAFNDGDTDVMLLNASGATGISLHSSVKFKDQKPRVLISGQLELDIGKEIQKRGRVDRTGQVHRARYEYIVSAIPAEQRLLMMFKAKLKSLDANTTSSQKSKSTQLKVEDFLNKYGDEVVTQYVKENAEFNEKIMDPFKLNHKSDDEIANLKKADKAASQVTGRVAILPTNEQEAFYSDIMEQYISHMNYLKDNNENDLEVKLLALNATTTNSVEVIQGRGTNSPFGESSIRETVEVDVLKKPLTKEEIDAEIEENLNGKTPRESRDNLLKEVEAYEEPFIEEKVKKIIDKFNDHTIPETIARAEKRKNREGENVFTPEQIEQLRQELIQGMELRIERERAKYRTIFGTVTNTIRSFTPGDVYNIPTSTRIDTNTTFSNAVFLGFHVKEGAANKYTPGSIIMKFAANDSRRIVPVPMTKTEFINATIAQSRYIDNKETIRNDWDKRLSKKTRGTRYIITGNLLQAYGTNDGQLVAYTTSTGAIRKGLLLPDTYQAETQKFRTTISKAFADNPSRRKITSTDDEVAVEREPRGGVTLTVPLSRLKGGKYFLDEELRALVNGNDFRQRAGKMEGYVNENNIQPLLLRLDALGVTVDSDIERPNDRRRDYQVKSEQPTDVEEMKDVILDLINDGITSLKKIEDLVAAELGEQARPLVKQAYNEATKEVKLTEGGKNELTTGFAKRINNFIDAIFGKSRSENTVVLKDTQALMDKAEELGANTFQNINGTTEAFYSPLEKFIDSSKQGAFTTDQILGQIKTLPQAEIEAIGLKDFLEGKTKVTKQELLEYVRDNKVNVEVLQKKDAPMGAEQAALKKAYDNAQHRLIEIQDKYAKGNQVENKNASSEPNIKSFWGYTARTATHSYEFIPLPTKIAAELDEIQSRIDAYYDYEDRNDMSGRINTKYSKYTLPGEKSNYREVLLTLPNDRLTEEEKDSLRYSEIHRRVRELSAGMIDAPEMDALVKTKEFLELKSERDAIRKKYPDDKFLNVGGEKIMKTKDRPTPFKSSHFDEPNIIAHIRLTDRVTPEGKKILFVEEAQSDWAREGRKQGFRLPDEKLVATKIEKDEGGWKGAWEVRTSGGRFITKVFPHDAEADTEAAAVKEAQRRLGDKNNFASSQGVPDMPFKNDKWVELATKKAIQIAAQEGYDGIAWINGEQTKDRYDLSKVAKSVSAIKNNDGTYNLVIQDLKGEELPGYNRSGKQVSPKEMEDTIGKDHAKVLMDGADKRKGLEWKKGMRENPEFHTIQTKDLKVGGAWANNLYDKQIPKLVEKYSKQFGGQVVPEMEIIETRGKTKFGTQTNNQFGLEITPEMKANTQSLPMFMKEATGEVLGFTHNGKIYLNGEHLNPNTPVHEAGHIWVEWAKDNDIDLYNRGIELINKSEYLAKVKANKFYQSEAAKLPEGEREAYYQHEALAAAIGDKGAQFIVEAKRKSFAEWAKDLWDKIGQALGFKGVTAAQLQNMSFDDFVQRAAVDILKGQPQATAKEQQQQPEPEPDFDEEGPLRRFTKQVLTDEAILPKGRIAEKLIYVRQTNAMSIEEATEIIDQIGVDAAWDLVLHDKDLNGAVRSVLGQMLIRKFNHLAANATDEETRNYYIDKTVEAADFVTEKLATDAGQQIQAFKLYAELSPEAQLRSAIKDIKKQAEKRKQRRNKDLLRVARDLNRINEEAAEELLDSASIDEAVESTEKTRVERAEDKIKKARERRQKLIDRHKSNKGQNLYSAVPGLTSEGIEFVGNLAKTYIDEGLANLEVIAGKIIEHLRTVTGKDVDAITGRNIRDIVQPLIEKGENERIATGLKDLEKDIHRIIKEHYTVDRGTKEDLIDKFMEQADLEGADARELANSVQEEFEKIATRRKQELFAKDKKRLDRITNGLAGAKTIERKTLEDEIIRLSNLGTVDNETLLKLLANLLGTGKLSPEQGKRILFLAERIKNAPEGAPKREAVEDLLVYRAKLKGTSWGEVAQGVWYANVLAGISTHAKNIISTFFNGFSFFSVQLFKDPLSLPFLLYGGARGFKRGLFEAWHTITTGRSPIHISKVETPNILERITFKGGLLNPYNYLKFVSRIMIAEDVLQFQGLKEMRATQLAYREAKRAGHRNPFSKATWEIVNDKLLNTSERLEEATEQAEEEGFTGRNARRRIYELMELSRPIQMTTDAYGFAAKGTFNHDTEGTLGALTDAVARLVDTAISAGGAKPLRFVIPFTRIITNVANNTIDFSPLGFVRWGFNRRGLLASAASGKRREMTPEERKDTIIKASLGIASMTALYGLARLGVIAISGAGPDDLKKRQQLLEEGWQPYSIKIGDTWYSYKLTPMVFAWGIVGSVRDNEEYGREDDQTAGKRVALAAWDGVKLLSDMTWINSAAPVMTAISSGNPNEAGAILTNSGKNIVKGFIIPNIYTQTAERAQYIFNVPTKQANNLFETLIMNVPIARNSLDDKINALGDPIIKDVDIIYSSQTTDPVWRFLLDKKGWVAPVNKGTLIVYDYTTRQERPINNDEYYTFSKSRGQKMRSAIQGIMLNGVMTKIVDGEEKFTINQNEATGFRGAAELNTKELNKVLTLYEAQATKDTKKELNYYPPDEK